MILPHDPLQATPLPRHRLAAKKGAAASSGAAPSRPPKEGEEASADLQQAKDDFIAQWGAMGNAWGVNRTMAQIHALLMVSAEPLSTDEIMEELKISRGNAHSNLRDLVGWGLIRSVIRKGERKEFFEAEKDTWRIFCTILRERKRREIDPVTEVLERCIEQTENLPGHEAETFHKQLKEVDEFVRFISKAMDKMARLQENQFMPAALKFLK